MFIPIILYTPNFQEETTNAKGTLLIYFSKFKATLNNSLKYTKYFL